MLVQQELLCTPNEKNMPMKGTYEIYYLGACGNLYTTNIIITYIPKIAITVLKLNNFCSSSPFTEISFTINAIPTGSIQKAILQNKKSLNLYNFQVCKINNKIVNCSNPDKEIIPGSYSLYSIEGVDNYTTLSEVKSTEIKYEIIL